MPKLAYEVLHPDRNTSCVVFASPHSGRDYPWRFLRTTVLNEHQVRSSEDAFVDKLFECAPRFGASFQGLRAACLCGPEPGGGRTGPRVD